MQQSNGKPLQQVPSQVLGTNSIDVTHLAAAYAGFAARGQYCTPIAITDVADATRQEGQGAQDQVLEGRRLRRSPTRSPGSCRACSPAAPAPAGHRPPAAGKTGTCEAHSCALFAGYTPDLAAAVWYGDPAAPYGNPSPGIYGAQIGRIWQASMESALRGTKPSSFHTPVNDFGNLDQARIPDVHGLPVGRRQAADPGRRVPRPGVAARDRLEPAQGHRRVHLAQREHRADKSTSVMIFVSNGNDAGGRPRRHGRRPSLAVLTPSCP